MRKKQELSFNPKISHETSTFSVIHFIITKGVSDVSSKKEESRC